MFGARKLGNAHEVFAGWKPCHETDLGCSAPAACHGGGLWYVFHDPHKRAEVIDAFRHADKIYLAIGWQNQAMRQIFSADRCTQWLKRFLLEPARFCSLILRSKSR